MADKDNSKRGAGAASATKPTSTDEGSGGAPPVPDWESDENPYKKRFQGAQKSEGQLRRRVDDLERTNSDLSGITSTLAAIGKRIDSVEDRTAEAADLAERAARTDDFDDSPPSTNRVERVRQARTQSRHVDKLNAVYSGITSGWKHGMDPNDPRVKRASQLYQEAKSDLGRTADLDEAERLWNEYAREFESKAPAGDAGSKPSDNTPDPARDGQDDDDEDADELEGDADDGDDAVEEPPPTKRQQLARRLNGSEGDGLSGSAAPADENLSGLDYFKRSHENS